MAKTQSTRKRFLQLLGISTGATLIGGQALAAGINYPDIRMLKREHQEFMTRYEKWIDEYIQVIRIRKSEPGNMENHKAMMALTEKAETFKPELAKYMQDETFTLFFRSTIEKMTQEIPA